MTLALPLLQYHFHHTKRALISCDFIREDRAFIYMDEYFQTNEVPVLFAIYFLDPKVWSKHSYIRNAGAYAHSHVNNQVYKK